jgi:hypothetical protein
MVQITIGDRDRGRDRDRDRDCDRETIRYQGVTHSAVHSQQQQGIARAVVESPPTPTIN